MEFHIRLLDNKGISHEQLEASEENQPPSVGIHEHVEPVALLYLIRLIYMVHCVVVVYNIVEIVLR